MYSLLTRTDIPLLFPLATPMKIMMILTFTLEVECLKLLQPVLAYSDLRLLDNLLAAVVMVKNSVVVLSRPLASNVEHHSPEEHSIREAELVSFDGVR